MLINYEHGIQELPQELHVQPSSQNEIFENTTKKAPEKPILNFSHSAIFYQKARVCLKYFVND